MKEQKQSKEESRVNNSKTTKEVIHENIARFIPSYTHFLIGPVTSLAAIIMSAFAFSV